MCFSLQPVQAIGLVLETPFQVCMVDTYNIFLYERGGYSSVSGNGRQSSFYYLIVPLWLVKGTGCQSSMVC